MKLKPIQYIDNIKREITITSSTDTRLYFSHNGEEFRFYPGKKINFFFESNPYTGIYREIQTVTKEIIKYLEVSEGSIVIPDNTVLSIFDTFKSTKHSQLVTIQDIVENTNAEKATLNFVDNLPIKSKSGSIGLLSDLDKSKLDLIKYGVSSETPISISNTEIELFSFKVSDLKENEYRLQLISNNYFLDCSIQYESINNNIIFNNHGNNLIGDEIISINFKLYTSVETEDVFVGVFMKNNLEDPTEYNVNLFTNDLDSIGLPGEFIFAINQILLNVDKISIDINQYLVSFCKDNKLELLPAESSGALTEEVVAVGVNDSLGIPDGTRYPQGLTFTDWLKDFVRKVIHPTYYSPTLSVNLSQSSIVEIGTIVDVIISAFFTQRDGGELISFEYSHNDIPISTKIENTEVKNISFTDATETLKVVATYGEGEVKINNVGEEDSVGQILAGSIQSIKNIMGDFLVFAGSEEEAPGVVDSVFVRGASKLNNSFRTLTNTFSLDISNSKHVWIAVPPEKSLDTLNTINPGTNEKVFDGIEPLDVDVECANNSGEVHTYRIYRLITVVAWAPNTTINVVLNTLN